MDTRTLKTPPLTQRATATAPSVASPVPGSHHLVTTVGGQSHLTFGVEEEFLLVDARTWRLVPEASELLDDVREAALTLHGEGTSYQVESATPVCDTLDSMRERLVESRGALAAAARRRGCRLIANASPVLNPEMPIRLNLDKPRRRVRQAYFGALTDNLIGCGRHVHVGSLDLDTAAQVSNRIRPWLPTFIALSASSPIWNGRDTGHASWRSIMWASWPSAGVPPHFAAPGGHTRAVRSLIDSGAALDEGMVYWDMRPSVRWPTIELRAPDMSPSLDGALFQASLSRALVTHALRREREGVPCIEVPDAQLRLARWLAAREGLEGHALDPFTGVQTSAAGLARRLVNLLGPELDAVGDYAFVTRTLGKLVKQGSWAARQRTVFNIRNCPTDVLHYLAEETEAF
ncbi:carboxylate-amine ligase [Streptomyces vinaceus]|uniref:carboxylate-amine ligase n=1 Tax=Streptomyces vinaceus TaxID=1960 RepID=UPI00380DD439